QESVLSSFFPLFLFHSCPAFSVHLFGDASLWHTHKLRPESEPHLVPSRFLPLPPKRTTSSGIVIPQRRILRPISSFSNFQQFLEFLEISFSPNFTPVLNDGSDEAHPDDVAIFVLMNPPLMPIERAS